VFNLLEAFIVDGWGEDTYDEILGACPLHTKEPFVGPGTYPDADLFAIASKTAERLGLPLPDALRAFGQFCLPRLVDFSPALVAEYRDPRALLLRVDDAIHVEVRKLLPKAVTPRFTFAEGPDGALVLRYESARKLCAFLEGLLVGLAQHFDHAVRYDHAVCMHDGHDHCELVVAFEPLAAAQAA
jgi:hypothetical protein